MGQRGLILAILSIRDILISQGSIPTCPFVFLPLLCYTRKILRTSWESVPWSEGVFLLECPLMTDWWDSLYYCSGLETYNGLTMLDVNEWSFWFHIYVMYPEWGATPASIAKGREYIQLNLCSWHAPMRGHVLWSENVFSELFPIVPTLINLRWRDTCHVGSIWDIIKVPIEDRFYCIYY